MRQGEAAAAWRLFTWNWILLGAMALTLVLALALTDFSIKPMSLLLPGGAIVVYAGAAYANALRPHRREPLVVFTLGATAQLMVITLVMTPLTYVAAAAGMPMQDANLAALDRALGLDWHAYFEFFYMRPRLIPILVPGYAMIAWPVFGVPVVLGVARRYERLMQFTLAFAIALAVTTAISALVPALGTYSVLSLNPDPSVFTSGAYEESSQLMPLIRNGTLRALDATHLIGVVTFPSFHACAAALYLWAFWTLRWLRPVAVAVMGTMLVATPIGGAHYFVDIFAGIGVAVLAIAAAGWIGERMMRPARAAVTAPEASGAPAPVRVSTSR